MLTDWCCLNEVGNRNLPRQFATIISKTEITLFTLLSGLQQTSNNDTSSSLPLIVGLIAAGVVILIIVALVIVIIVIVIRGKKRQWNPRVEMVDLPSSNYASLSASVSHSRERIIRLSSQYDLARERKLFAFKIVIHNFFLSILHTETSYLSMFQENWFI